MDWFLGINVLLEHSKRFIKFYLQMKLQILAWWINHNHQNPTSSPSCRHPSEFCVCPFTVVSGHDSVLTHTPSLWNLETLHFRNYKQEMFVFPWVLYRRYIYRRTGLNPKPLLVRTNSTKPCSRESAGLREMLGAPHPSCIFFLLIKFSITFSSVHGLWACFLSKPQYFPFFHFNKRCIGFFFY